MIAYHGSNSNFRQLRIAKSLVKHTSTLDNEGLGIYFSTDKEVAKSYGKYLYTLEINNKYFRDFRNIKTCRQYLALLSQEVYKRFKIDILYFIDMI